MTPEYVAALAVTPEHVAALAVTPDYSSSAFPFSAATFAATSGGTSA
jgi:hypothetical protein